MIKVLEVNVDDLHSGGVFSLVKNVIHNNPNSDIKIDIAAIEKFQNQSNIDFLKKHNCDVFYVGSEENKWTKQIAVYRNIRHLVLEGNYNYVHIHADTANKLMVSGLGAKKAGVKDIILHSHSAGIDGGHRLFKLFVHKVCRAFLRSIGSTYVACSDLAASWMYPNILAEEIIIIKNGVDLKKFRFNLDIRNRVRKELGAEKAFLIGHVGRFLYQKNHEFIVEIMSKIKSVLPEAKLLLVGEGDREDEIKQLVKEKHLEEDIIFYGTSNRVNELMQAMDVFILPSHFEGLPIVGVEAQAAGLPVIFSDKITKEASLTDNVKYLSIGEDEVESWVHVISEMKDSNTDRGNAYKTLIDKRFDISDTVCSFLDLYQNNERIV